MHSLAIYTETVDNRTVGVLPCSRVSRTFVLFMHKCAMPDRVQISDWILHDVVTWLRRPIRLQTPGYYIPNKGRSTLKPTKTTSKTYRLISVQCYFLMWLIMNRKHSKHRCWDSRSYCSGNFGDKNNIWTTSRDLLELHFEEKGWSGEQRVIGRDRARDGSEGRWWERSSV